MGPKKARVYIPILGLFALSFLGCQSPTEAALARYSKREDAWIARRKQIIPALDAADFFARKKLGLPRAKQGLDLDDESIQASETARNTWNVESYVLTHKQGGAEVKIDYTAKVQAKDIENWKLIDLKFAKAAP